MGHKFIINGDDFGFSPAYNAGLIHSYLNGVLSSATVMVNMGAAREAVSLANEYNLHIGLHVNIVQGYPCSNPKNIPSIVRSDGHSYSSSDYKNHYKSWQRGNDDGTGIVANKEDYKKEVCAQIERFKELSGYYPTHIEGHSIISPELTEGLYEVANQYHCHVLRFDNQPQDGYYNASELLTDSGVMKAMSSYMDNGATPEMIQNVFVAMKANPCDFNIVHFHPGWIDKIILNETSLIDARAHDESALCDHSVINWIRENNIELVNFDDLKISV